MLKNIDAASAQYKLHTSHTTVKMRMTMMMFTAPLYLDDKGMLTIANGYVNHNFQNWSGGTAMEITNNIYNNPLKHEIKHEPTAGDNMKLLLICYTKVSETQPTIFSPRPFFNNDYNSENFHTLRNFFHTHYNHQ